MERDLLRRDRGDERFEGIDRERRAKAREPLRGRGEHLLALRECVERLQIEVEADQLAHDRLDLVVERLGVHPAGRVGDTYLASGDDAVEAAVVPDVRAVDAPECEAVERGVEVVGLRNRY